MTRSPSVLYRQLLREAKHMKDYNFRNYALRRIKLGFEEGKAMEGESSVEALSFGEQQLELLKRQSLLTRLYPSAKSVME
eukprot:CAMPEP_0118714226 /NCGR_PEP_ID=MMETSP0800-20121206/26051_1 /TAXON_ID=210618 ORGANISM="Striatella unipunctata, Strain CCMP2910" /NCGR_SAMPLE_ID=MMETSP0800 /ASSEMBLY_ACC=CAM_ASM_000638 /LENGTH=79 /DNA_ID=CAMNT_0006619959 /DNA_START=22 /DNA_END=261 /DNA_ORIENTATION=+